MLCIKRYNLHDKGGGSGTYVQTDEKIPLEKFNPAVS